MEKIRRPVRCFFMVFVFKPKPNRQGRKRIRHNCHLELLEHGFPSLNELSGKHAERWLPDTRYVHWKIVGHAAMRGKDHQGCSLDQTGDPRVTPAQDCALRKGRCPCLSLERKNPAKKAGLRNSTRGGKPRARKTAATPRVQPRGPIRRLSERIPASGSVAGGSFGNQA